MDSSLKATGRNQFALSANHKISLGSQRGMEVCLQLKYEMHKYTNCTNSKWSNRLPNFQSKRQTEQLLHMQERTNCTFQSFKTNAQSPNWTNCKLKVTSSNYPKLSKTAKRLSKGLSKKYIKYAGKQEYAE